MSLFSKQRQKKILLLDFSLFLLFFTYCLTRGWFTNIYIERPLFSPRPWPPWIDKRQPLPRSNETQCGLLKELIQIDREQTVLNINDILLDMRTGWLLMDITVDVFCCSFRVNKIFFSDGTWLTLTVYHILYDSPFNDNMFLDGKLCYEIVVCWWSISLLCILMGLLYSM